MYDHLLVPTDGSNQSNAGVTVGLDLAQLFDATVHFLSVVDSRITEPLEIAELDETLQREARAAIDRAESHEGEEVRITTETRKGVPFREIQTSASEHDIDCIVMGTSGRHARPGSFGSTTTRVLRDVDIPVMTVRPSDGEQIEGSQIEPDGDVLIATDGSDPAHRSFEAGLEIARYLDVSLHAIYVVDSDIFTLEESLRSLLGPLREGGKTALEEFEVLAAEEGVSLQSHLVEGIPEDVILTRESQLDVGLICVGRRGQTGLPDVRLGSTTDRIVRRATVPVLSIP